jgi:hypothetical protein
LLRQLEQLLLWKQTLAIQQARTQTDGKFYPKTTATASSRALNWQRRPVPSEFEHPFLLERWRSKLSLSSLSHAPHIRPAKKEVSRHFANQG